MTDSAHSQALRTADPFMTGAFGAAMMGLGYPMSSGICFPDLEGPVVLFRRQLYPGAVGDWHVAGTAQADAGSIENGSGISHAASSGYEYAAARCLGNGFMSELCPPIRIDFDAGGSILTDMPTWPRDMDVVPIAGGKFQVSWSYTSWGQSGWPADFEIFEGADGSSIDYNTAIGTVNYSPSTLRYLFESPAYGDGTPHAFAVRARNSNGDRELNEFTTVAMKAEASTPNSAAIASAVIRPAGG